MKPILLNLASHPQRNRRLFLLASGGLTLASIVAIVLAVIIFSSFALKIKRTRAELDRLDQSIGTAQRVKTHSQAKVQQAMKRETDMVEFVNALILQKSFSWSEFMSRLEDGLPDASYILSLAPVAVENSRVQFQLRVASSGLDEQLALINKLLELNFSQVRVQGEDTDDRGRLISDILVTYERHI